MSLNLTIPQTDDHLKPRITVIGIGGAGGNAVTNMIMAGLEGVEFLVTNTDAQALSQSACPRKIQLGRNLTRGLGAGARPDVGRAAAEEAMDEILASLDGCNMVFITAGMGGGTGTGAAPVIARAAREQGILTVGVITKPFHFEGVHRMRLAEAGIAELTQHVDTLIIIPNQNLFRVANEKTTFADAFKMADDVLESGVRGVTDLMVLPGLINLDFNDIRTVMTEMGKAMMGTGEAEGDDRAIKAAEAAIANPLLDDVSMRGAKGLLISITGGRDLTLFEVDEAANKIREQVDPEANIIFGSCLDDKLQGKMRVSIVATGIDVEAGRNERSTAPSLSLIAAERERRRPQPAPQPQPAASVAVAGGGGHALVHEALRSQPVTLGATATVLQPRHEPAPQPMPQQAVESRPLALELPEPEPDVLELVEEAEEPAEADSATVEEFHAQGYQTQDYRSGDFAAAPAMPEPEPEPEMQQPAPAFLAPEPVAETSWTPVPDADSFAREIEARSDGFVAPAPLAVERASMAPPPRPQPQPRPDPFREAELANASSRPAEPARGRGPSLISKVTGLGRLLGGAPGSAQPAVPPAEQRATVAKAAQSVRAAPPSQPAMPPRAEVRPQAAQPRLNLDTGDRRTNLADEHLLDIPAFLRRQAN